jgi:dTDP-4-amino-4,6-dideoxygalactose transaminase
MTAGRLTAFPPLPPSIYLARRAHDPPYPLNDPRCVVFSRARHGLWHGLRASGLGSGDEVLVPAFNHGSEVEALERSGLTCRFYDATETLVPDEAELESLIGPRVRALYLVHYLGFPQDAAYWRDWCDARELLLIEDAAMAWLSTINGQPVGSFGDCGIFCLYKTYGLPDGGAVVTRRPLGSKPKLARRTGAVALARRHGTWALQRWGWLATLSSGRGEPDEYDWEADFHLGDPGTPTSVATTWLLPRLRAEPAAQRRANYRYLLKALGESTPSPFRTLPAGASPFVFPLQTADKQSMLGRLRTQRIMALSLWSTPHPSLRTRRFAQAELLRDTILGLPVHQELRLHDLERIVTAVNRCQ